MLGAPLAHDAAEQPDGLGLAAGLDGPQDRRGGGVLPQFGAVRARRPDPGPESADGDADGQALPAGQDPREPAGAGRAPAARGPAEARRIGEGAQQGVPTPPAAAAPGERRRGQAGAEGQAGGVAGGLADRVGGLGKGAARGVELVDVRGGGRGGRGVGHGILVGFGRDVKACGTGGAAVRAVRDADEAAVRRRRRRRRRGERVSGG